MEHTHIIFDLDDTLYPRESGLMQEIGRRIHVWVCDYLGLTWDEAVVKRREYYHRYGTTLDGLMVEHGMDAHGYLDFVHDIAIEEYLAPSPALAEMLDRIPLRKAIYTNATSKYGWRVAQALGVAEHFEHVIGIEEMCLRNKFHRDAYERALALLDTRGPACIMVEDSAHNLRPAKALGLTTVLVDTGGPLAQRCVSQPDPAPAPPEYVDFLVGDVLEVEGIVRRLLLQNA